MNFSHSDKVRELQRVAGFIERFVYPAESRFQDEVARNRRAGNPWLATEVGLRDGHGRRPRRKKEIAMIKVAAPKMACRVVDWAIQVHGGAGVSQDFLLAHAYASARSLRLADGPDEVHRAQIGQLELSRYRSA
jgi:alkylation response protein AidB-like acyl-CoA dehydrogenase